MDVIVTDKGDHPRTDLGPADFEILEDGQPQPITHFARGFTAGPVGRPPRPQAPGIAAFPDEGTPRGPPPRARRRRLPPRGPGPRHREEGAPPASSTGRSSPATRWRWSRRAGAWARSSSSRPTATCCDAPWSGCGCRTDPSAPRRTFPRLTRLPGRADRRPATRKPSTWPCRSSWPRSPPAGQDENAQMRAEQRIRTMARADRLPDRQPHVPDPRLARAPRSRGLTPLRGRKVVALFSGGFFLGSDRQSSRRDLEVIADAAMRAGVVIYTVDARGLVATPAIGDASVGRKLRHHDEPRGARADRAPGDGGGPRRHERPRRGHRWPRPVQSQRPGRRPEAGPRGQRELLPSGLRAAGLSAGRTLSEDRSPGPGPLRAARPYRERLPARRPPRGRRRRRGATDRLDPGRGRGPTAPDGARLLVPASRSSRGPRRGLHGHERRAMWSWSRPSSMRRVSTSTPPRTVERRPPLDLVGTRRRREGQGRRASSATGWSSA